MNETQTAAVTKIQARIAAVATQRDALIAEANQQIAFLNGKIAALQELIAPAEPPHDEQAHA